MHPLHEGQPRAGHPHHAGPHPEAALLAVRQDPQGGVQVLLLPAVLVVRPRQGLLGHPLIAHWNPYWLSIVL